MATKKKKTTRVSTHDLGSASGLLNSKGLFQATDDEKLVVATLATLDSGNAASSLIKQELKWIIQSRRKAEGKEEIHVEFKNPAKDELTSEEVIKRVRRRELNRLAARRSREKGQRRKERLVEEIKYLQSQNMKLKSDLTHLSDERDNIVQTLKIHMHQCSDQTATQNAAAAGVPPRILEKFGMLKEVKSVGENSLVTINPVDSPADSSQTVTHLHIDVIPSSCDAILDLPETVQNQLSSSASNFESQEFTLPLSSAPPRPLKLERSISCPSTSLSSPSKKRYVPVDCPSSMSSTPLVLTTSDDDCWPFEHTPPSSQSSLSSSQSSCHSVSLLNEQNVPLNLVMKSKPYDSCKFVHHTQSATWPGRLGGRAMGRRWSVDDNRSSYLVEPLNLTTGSLACQEFENKSGIV